MSALASDVEEPEEAVGHGSMPVLLELTSIICVACVVHFIHACLPVAILYTAVARMLGMYMHECIQIMTSGVK